MFRVLRPAALARFDALLERLRAADERVPDLFVTSRAAACMAVGRLDEAEQWLARHPPAGRDGMGLQDLGWQLTRGRLAWLRGEPTEAWLEPAAQAVALPPGITLQREAVLASMRAPRPGDAAARAALAEGDREGARRQLKIALARAATVDAWVDEPASLWLAAAEVLAACGQGAEADAAVAAGADWVRRHAAQWSTPEDRATWCDGHPVHRALLARAERLPPPAAGAAAARPLGA